MKMIKLDQRSIYLRKIVLSSLLKKGRGHIGPAMSIIEILRVIYDKFLKTSKTKRDRFILSKGHGCLALYAILYEKGLIKKKDLESFGAFESILGGHPLHFVPGVEFSTGALGHGYPIAAGVAKGIKLKKNNSNVFCLLGDGEINEGSVWETALSVSKHNLNNLITLIDYNKLQSYDYNKIVLNLEPLTDKWKSFGFKVFEAKGHDLKDIYKKIFMAKKTKIPSVIIFHTIKGKGIKSAENNRYWHHKANLSKEEIEKLNKELTQQ